jgi:diguanylate cyclase (GGDEF)-like protein
VNRPFRLVTLGALPEGFESGAWGPFSVDACQDVHAVAAQLQASARDAVVIATADAAEAQRLAVWPALSVAVLDAALVVVAPAPTPALAARLLSLGVQDVLGAAEASASALGRAVRLAIERKAIEKAARTHATDPATGLPNHAMLMEHMTHLLALREREPAPMALLVVRIEGTATAEARVGRVAANVLRRKAAVRLRATLRASDVVASIGHDIFAVLLAWIDAPDDAERVAAKLVHTLLRPFRVSGESLALATSVGVSLYPEHGQDADTLLRRAGGLAASALPVGRPGFANAMERGAPTAANDDEA